jgi:hypothetical protein
MFLILGLILLAVGILGLLKLLALGLVVSIIVIVIGLLAVMYDRRMIWRR